MEKEKIRRGFTVKSLLIGLILVIGWTVANAFLWSFDQGWPPHGYMYAYTWFTMFLLWTFLSVSRRLRITRQEFVTIWAMLLVSQGATLFGPPRSWLWGIVDNAVTWEHFDICPKLLIPDSMEALNQFYEGGHPVPWVLWATPILYWICYSILWMLYPMFFMLLWRKQWVDVETLPFPMTYPIIGMSEAFSEDPEIRKNSSVKSRKYQIFLLGLIISLVYTGFGGFSTFEPYPGTWHEINPNIPAIQFKVDLASVLWSVFPGSILVFSVLLPTIAIFLLSPMSIQWSILFYTILLWYILEPIGFIMGWTPQSDPSWFGWNRWYNFYGTMGGWAQGGAGGFAIWHMVLGSLVGLGLWPMIFKWRHFLDTIKGIFRKTDDSEPFSYRVTWALFLVTTLAFWGMHVAIGQDPYIAFMGILLWLLFSIGNARLLAVSSGSIGDSFAMYWGGVNIMQGFFYPDDTPTTPLGAQNWYVTDMTANMWFKSASFTNAGYLVLQAMNVASATKTRNRDFVLAMILSIIVSMVVGYIIMLWLSYTFGFGTKFRGPWTSGWQTGACWSSDFHWSYTSSFAWLNGYYGIGWIGGAFRGWGTIFGFALAGISLIALRRWPFLPIHPAAIPIVTSLANWQVIAGAGIYCPLIKYAILKIGGTKLWRKIEPFLWGLVAGGGAAIILRNIVVLARSI